MGGMRYQPAGLARLNRAIPQLAGAVAIAGNADPRNGRRPSPTTVDTPHGRAAGFSFTGNLSVPYAALNIPTTPSWTVLMVIRKDANQIYPYFLGTLGGSAANTALAAAHAAVGNRLAIYDGSGVVRDSGLLLDVGRFYVVALSFDAGTSQFSWCVDGVQRATTPGVGLGGSSWHICGTTGQPTALTLPLLAIIPRVLPAEIARSLTTNPWLIFEDDDIDFSPQSVVQHVLVVQQAVMSISGGQVGMRVSRRLRAAPATLTLAAGQIAVRASRRMSVQPASLAMLAGSTRMLVSRRFGVAPAAMDLAGQGVMLRAARRLQVSPTAVALAGGQVHMQYAPAPLPGSYTLPVSAAAMTLGGSSVGMRVTRRLPVVPAAIIIEGQQVSFLLGGRTGAIDASKVPSSRTAKFAGGKRLVIFSGGVRVATFNGGKRTVRF